MSGFSNSFLFFSRCFFIYKLLDREFGIYAALAGTITLTSGLLTILEKGNVTEEYALVFQALCFLAVRQRLEKGFSHSHFVLDRTCWADLAFNFKQTTIGIWITYGLFLLAIRLLQRKFPFKDLLSLLAGWLIPSLVLILYLASQNALTDFWEQAFLYNFVYIGKHEGIRRLIPVFIKGFAYLRNGWVLYLSILGWLAGLGYLWLKRKNVAEIHPLIPDCACQPANGNPSHHDFRTFDPSLLSYPFACHGDPGRNIGLYCAVLDRANSLPLQSSKRSRMGSGIRIGACRAWAIRADQKLSRVMSMRLQDNDYAPVIDYVAKNTKAR